MYLMYKCRKKSLWCCIIYSALAAEGEAHLTTLITVQLSSLLQWFTTRQTQATYKINLGCLENNNSAGRKKMNNFLF